MILKISRILLILYSYIFTFLLETTVAFFHKQKLVALVFPGTHLYIYSCVFSLRHIHIFQGS